MDLHERGVYLGVLRDQRLWRARVRGSTGQGEDLCGDAGPNNSPDSEKGLWSTDCPSTLSWADERFYATSISVTWGHQGNECDLGEAAVCS